MDQGVHKNRSFQNQIGIWKWFLKRGETRVPREKNQQSPVPGGLSKSNRGKLAPKTNPLPFCQKRYPFYIPFIGNRYPFLFTFSCIA